MTGSAAVDAGGGDRTSRDPCCSVEDMAMRSFDFAPLSRSTIGFDRMMQLFEDAARFDSGETSYPPYNIEKLGEDSYRITMAMAGFAEGDLSTTQQANSLIVAGRKQGAGTAEYLHHGLAAHAFERLFDPPAFITAPHPTSRNPLLATTHPPTPPQLLHS